MTPPTPPTPTPTSSSNPVAQPPPGSQLPPPAPPTADDELDATVETGSDAPIGAIVGGVAAAVLILVGLLCLYIRKKKKAMGPPLSVKAVDTKARDLELASKEAEPPTTSEEK